MVSLLYWGNNEYGHAAVFANGHYLSFHPARRDKVPWEELVGVPSKFNEHYNDDIEDCGGTPHQIDASHLDDDKVARRIWELRQQAPQYSFFTNNCSHMALKALIAGMSDEDHDIAHDLIDGLRRVGGHGVEHVGGIDQLVDYIVDNGHHLVPAFSRTRGPVFAIASAVAGIAAIKRVGITSPADVVRFVQNH